MDFVKGGGFFSFIRSISHEGPISGSINGRPQLCSILLLTILFDFDEAKVSDSFFPPSIDVRRHEGDDDVSFKLRKCKVGLVAREEVDLVMVFQHQL